MSCQVFSCQLLSNQLLSCQSLSCQLLSCFILTLVVSTLFTFTLFLILSLFSSLFYFFSRHFLIPNDDSIYIEYGIINAFDSFLILKISISFYLCICHLSVSIIWIWQYTFYSMHCQICLAYIYSVERSQQRRHSKSIWSSFHRDRKVRLHLGIKSLSCRGVWIYKSQFILQAGSRKSSFLIYTNLSISRCEASKM